jgi:hypothetical protein
MTKVVANSVLLAVACYLHADSAMIVSDIHWISKFAVILFA